MMNSLGNMYIIALDIKDLNHNVGYYLFTHIINSMHDKWKISNFTLFIFYVNHLYKNIQHTSPYFIKGIEEIGESLPVQLWTRVCQRYYPYSNALAVHNDFVHPISNMLVDITKRVPSTIKMISRPSVCPNEDRRLGHDWGSFFLFDNFFVIRVYGCL